MGDKYLAEFRNAGKRLVDERAKEPKRPAPQKPLHEDTEHDYLHVSLDERIGEYRTNIVIFVPSTDKYRGVSGFGPTVDEAKSAAFREAGKRHGTFTHVTYNEYLHLPKDIRNEVVEDWETFREQVIKEADTINYIVYTREIPKAYFCPALVTQSLMHAKFVAEDMRSAGYEDVILVETPQLTPGLTAPKLKDPAVKFKRISDAMTPEERKMYEGLPTEDSTIIKQESANPASVCPVCHTEMVRQCRCSSKIKHTVEDLEKGHGKLCANGHRWSDDLILEVGIRVTPKGDLKYMTEAEKKRMQEQPAPDIKAKHPGILGIKPGEFMKKKSAYFISLAKSKGRAAIQKALLNLERWNKNDDPPISKRARVHINAIMKAFGD